MIDLVANVGVLAMKKTVFGFHYLALLSIYKYLILKNNYNLEPYGV